MIVIDGAQQSGSGTVVRSAIAFSAILGQPLPTPPSPPASREVCSRTLPPRLIRCNMCWHRCSSGRFVAEALLADLARGATVDRHMADQLVLFTALAEGTSRYLMPYQTGHLASNLWLASQFGALVMGQGQANLIEGYHIRLQYGELVDHQLTTHVPAFVVLFEIECRHAPWHHRSFQPRGCADREGAVMDTGRGVSSQEASSSSSYERTSGLASAVHTCTPTQLAVALATSPLPPFVKGGKRDTRGDVSQQIMCTNLGWCDFTDLTLTCWHGGRYESQSSYRRPSRRTASDR
jgi:RNA 3'-terminal phosphate cyclase